VLWSAAGRGGVKKKRKRGKKKKRHGYMPAGKKSYSLRNGEEKKKKKKERRKAEMIRSGENRMPTLKAGNPPPLVKKVTTRQSCPRRTRIQKSKKNATDPLDKK